jgi:hypothetical protein
MEEKPCLEPAHVELRSRFLYILRTVDTPFVQRQGWTYRLADRPADDDRLESVAFAGEAD